MDLAGLKQLNRGYTVHRSQIGIAGCVMVLVMVGLADMLLEGASNERPVVEQIAEDGNPGVGSDATNPHVPQTSEPLIDLGVVPDLPAEEGAQTPAAPPAAQPQGQTVPDLPARQEDRPVRDREQ